MRDLTSKAATLIEAMPYIQDFRDEIVVVKFGGSAMEDPVLVEQVLRDIIFMECVGMKPVIVHGGGKAINARMEREGIPVRKVAGMRVTCEHTVRIVDEELHELNGQVLDLLTKNKARARRISGKDILTAEKMIVTDPVTGKTADVGFVGDVTHVYTKPILEVLQREAIPVICPLAVDAKGQVFNINADIAAAKIAKALKARKLVFLSDVPGMLRNPKDESTLISTIRIGEVDGYIADGTISGGMLPKVQSAVDALQAGCRKVHMIDGRLPHSLLLEFFTDKGVGTEIIH